jgi:hypothetical protein
MAKIRVLIRYRRTIPVTTTKMPTVKIRTTWITFLVKIIFLQMTQMGRIINTRSVTMPIIECATIALSFALVETQLRFGKNGGSHRLLLHLGLSMLPTQLDWSHKPHGSTLKQLVEEGEECDDKSNKACSVNTVKVQF